jgi:hypothetical protein
MLMIILTGIGLTTTAQAGGPESGFFIGGGANLQWVSGNGSWSTYEFDISQPLSNEENDPIGFAWTDKMLLGVKPVVGYKINGSLALQVGYGMNIPKPSNQSYSESNGLVFYQQGLNMEWEQRNLEILGILYPDSDINYYFFGGLDLVNVKTKISIFESAEFPDEFGNTIIGGEVDEQNDTITATGFILGTGLEFVSEDKRRVAYLSVQYSRSLTNDAFFGTEDFKVDLGGFTLMGGIKWYPFHR